MSCAPVLKVTPRGFAFCPGKHTFEQYSWCTGFSPSKLLPPQLQYTYTHTSIQARTHANTLWGLPFKLFIGRKELSFREATASTPNEGLNIPPNWFVAVTLQSIIFRLKPCLRHRRSARLLGATWGQPGAAWMKNARGPQPPPVKARRRVASGARCDALPSV